MSLNRRKFIQLSATTAIAAGTVPFFTFASGKRPPLPVPPLLESHYSRPLFLSLQPLHQIFTGTNRARIAGINGYYPAPTIRVRRGDDCKLVYSNRLEYAAAMTVYGLQVPGSLTGGTARQMQPGQEWAPVLPIRQPACTLCYRASTPEHCARQVYDGLVGMWLVEDELSRTLPLPQHYGVDDFPIIIQDKRLNRVGIPEYQPPASGGFLGNTLLVNGAIAPWLQVSRGWLRLRLLNASNARRYLLQCSDQRPLYVIAGDQGLLPAPVPVRQLALAPGERREVLLDMRDGNPVDITSGDAPGIMDHLRNLFDPSDVLSSNLLLTIKPDGLLPLFSEALPASLPAQPATSGVISQRRHFTLTDEPGINGQRWSASRIDVTTYQGNYEQWIIQADNPQSFHIAGARFLVTKVNGAQPLPEDRGWKDTVWVDGQVDLLVYFANISSVRYPFIYASQTLEMADRGSMGQILVNPPINSQTH